MPLTWGSPCRAEALTTIKLFGATETWHDLGVGNIKYAELLAMRTKYGQFVARRQAAGNTADVQTYACRAIRGTTTTVSLHSYPKAVDIRPPENPVSDDGVLRTDLTKFGLFDGFVFVSAFIAAGFEWGANWIVDDQQSYTISRWDLRHVGRKIRTGRVDAMHFQITPDPEPKDYWVRRVKRYATRHPVYMRRTYKAVGVTGAFGLVQAWYAGRA